MRPTSNPIAPSVSRLLGTATALRRWGGIELALSSDPRARRLLPCVALAAAPETLCFFWDFAGASSPALPRSVMTSSFIRKGKSNSGVAFSSSVLLNKSKSPRSPRRDGP